MNTDLERALDKVRMQESAIRDLSTPVLALGPGVLLAPIVGTLDSERARQLMEHIAAETVRTQAHAVIVDVAGVPIVDTQVGHTMIMLANTLQLLGARCIMTSIRPAVAQTIVQLGIDVRGAMDTHSTLAKGWEAARRA